MHAVRRACADGARCGGSRALLPRIGSSSAPALAPPAQQNASPPMLAACIAKMVPTPSCAVCCGGQRHAQGSDSMHQLVRLRILASQRMAHLITNNPRPRSCSRWRTLQGFHAS